MSDAIRTAIDASGRLVVPKPIRDELGIVAGTPLLLSVRDGRLEIEPVYAVIRTREHDGVRVAELVEPMPPLSESDLRAVRSRVRNRQG
jgi:AbrB family looped-hinge helix DNA binding protein